MRIVKVQYNPFRDYLGLAGWLLLCYAVAFFGSRFTPGIWYEQLAKPVWTPPPWVFGPAWFVLYTLMGIAAWLVWRKSGFEKATLPLVLFVTQLVFNAAWSWIFFGLQQPGLAFGEIVLLLLLVVATTLAFFKERVTAGALLVPYMLWLTFAAILNYSIWQMN